MKKLFVLLSSFVCLYYFNHANATTVELSMIETDRSLHVAPLRTPQTDMGHLDSIVVELSPEQGLKNNLQILQHISYDLDFAEQNFTKENLSSLQPFAPMISGLDLSDNFLTDIEGISVFTNLRKLNLANNGLDDLKLKFIGQLSNLVFLSLYHNKFTHSGILMLEGLKHLRKLNVSCNNLGSFGSKAILDTLPYLTDLEVRGCSLNDDSLGHLLEMPCLKHVDISSNKAVSSLTLKEFIKKAETKGLKVTATDLL